MKKIVLILLLFGCTKPDIIAPKQPDNQFVSQEVVGTPIDNISDSDVLGGILFENVNKYNNKPYGGLIVSKSNGYPVYDGDKSARFEIRDGDCGWNDNFSDCATDRSRSEFFESNRQASSGKTITYTENVFIPSQSKFKPNGGNLLVLTQVNFADSANAFGALTYLVMENNNRLLIRTHREFTWEKLNDYTITSSPYDKWINIKYVIKASDSNDGEIKVYVDDKLLFTETRPTLITKSGAILMKFGIYNSFKSRATESFSTQVVYFDGISKKFG